MKFVLGVCLVFDKALDYGKNLGAEVSISVCPDLPQLVFTRRRIWGILQPFFKSQHLFCCEWLHIFVKPVLHKLSESFHYCWFWFWGFNSHTVSDTGDL
jgi:hypothetical protein